MPFNALGEDITLYLFDVGRSTPYFTCVLERVDFYVCSSLHFRIVNPSLFPILQHGLGLFSTSAIAFNTLTSISLGWHFYVDLIDIGIRFLAGKIEGTRSETLYVALPTHEFGAYSHQLTAWVCGRSDDAGVLPVARR